MGEEPADLNDPSAYARHIETYLCRKNKGHLIRVVGPAFDLVRSWVAMGVPLKVAFRGIDRCCERRERPGPRRRPVRLEFCEADVLDAFDEWRRAVGVSTGRSDGGSEAAPRKPALAAHVERAMARLAYVRGAGAADSDLHRAVDAIIRELEELAPQALKARGEARSSLVARLTSLDTALMEAAVAQLDPGQRAALQLEASAELAPFASRMPSEARERAAHAAFLRLVRESAGLPTLVYE